MDFNIPRLLGALPALDDSELAAIAAGIEAEELARERLMIQQKIDAGYKRKIHGRLTRYAGTTFCGYVVREDLLASADPDQITCGNCKSRAFTSKIRRMSAACTHCEDTGNISRWQARDEDPKVQRMEALIGPEPSPRSVPNPEPRPARGARGWWHWRAEIDTPEYRAWVNHRREVFQMEEFKHFPCHHCEKGQA